MTTMNVTLRSIPDTGAAIGLAGAHTVVVDRPPGRAGGAGLGFNGGQLLALAIGGCLCNDLHYAADEMKVRLASLAIDVSVAFEGQPLLAVAAEVRVSAVAAEPMADVDAVLERAQSMSTVSNSLARGVPVRIMKGS